MRCGCIWSRASTPSTFTPGMPAVMASSSRASAPQPTITSFGAVASEDALCGTCAALVDEPARSLGSDASVAAIGIGPDGRPELLVQRRAADEHDVVVADALVPKRLDHDLHVRHGRGQQRRHA